MSGDVCAMQAHKRSNSQARSRGPGPRCRCSTSTCSTILLWVRAAPWRHMRCLAVALPAKIGAPAPVTMQGAGQQSAHACMCLAQQLACSCPCSSAASVPLHQQPRFEGASRAAPRPCDARCAGTLPPELSLLSSTLYFFRVGNNQLTGMCTSCLRCSCFVLTYQHSTGTPAASSV